MEARWKAGWSYVIINWKGKLETMVGEGQVAGCEKMFIYSIIYISVKGKIPSLSLLGY